MFIIYILNTYTALFGSWNKLIVNMHYISMYYLSELKVNMYREKKIYPRFFLCGYSLYIYILIYILAATVTGSVCHNFTIETGENCR